MKLAIIHFQPLEYYPPITNFLHYLAGENKINACVYTTSNNKKRKHFSLSRAKIFRSPLPVPNEKSCSRFYKYWLFNIITIWRLIKWKPEAIIYYESYSAFPVFIYSKWINKNVKIYIHFHEYFSKEWYVKGMRLVKWYNSLESKFLLARAIWISQTNTDRIKIFLSDNPEVEASKLKILPNYPPKSWSLQPRKKNFDKLRFVYIGSLSLYSTYMKDFCEWAKNYPQLISLDIYSFNIHDAARTYLRTLQVSNIKFYEQGIEYDRIPVTLDNYNIGLVLYKANTLNYVYNETNKLFEYLSRGLDVWFPQEVLGIYPFITNGEYPKVTKIDFNDLHEDLIKDTINRSHLRSGAIERSSESVYQQLVDHILSFT